MPDASERVLPQSGLEIEKFTLVVLVNGPRRAEYRGEVAQRLANEHVMYTIGLGEQGHLLAAGAIIDDGPGQEITGLGFSRKDPDELRTLIAKDPGVIAGMEDFKIVTYLTPKGGIDFPRRR